MTEPMSGPTTVAPQPTIASDDAETASPETRVVVTGIGVVAPVGVGIEEYWAAISAGRTGLSNVTSLDTTGYGSHLGGEVQGFVFDPRELPEADHGDRTTYFALAAGQQALDGAAVGLESTDRDRFGVVLGTCMGGMRSGELWHRQLITKGFDHTDHQLLLGYQFDAATNALSAKYQLKGPTATISTACAAGANAIGYASDFIRKGRADVMLAGGAESLAHMAYAGFSSLQSLSPTPCKPYSRDRSGLTLGEGAGVVVLERMDHALERGAHVYAEVLGYGLSVDGYHPTAPHPGGNGAARAIRLGLANAGVAASSVLYVNGHGTGTAKNDSAETNAIKSVFGAHASSMAVSSTKSMLGHSLGAAGAIEGLTTIMALDQGFVPPTISLDEPDPQLDLDYVPNVGRAATFDVALSNSFAFGGNNVAVLYGRAGQLPQSGRAARAVQASRRVVVTGISALTAAGQGIKPLWEAVKSGQTLVRQTDYHENGQPGGLGAPVPAFDLTQYLSKRETRRMDVSSKWAVCTAKMAVEDAGLMIEDHNRDRIGVIAGVGNGPSEAAVSFHGPLVTDGPAAASPAVFPNTVFNAAAGQVAIHLELHGCTTTVTSERASSATGLEYADDLLREGQADAIICIGLEEYDAVSMAGYTGLRAVGTQPQPFARGRDGFAPTGGAVALVLEDLGTAVARGARIYGEVVGGAITSGAVPTGQFDRSGESVARAMTLAMSEADIEPEDVGMICASASGSLPADVSEARGIRQAFGSYGASVPVTAFKGAVGEPWGASGSYATALSLMALNEQCVPPTAGLTRAGDGCELNHVMGAARSGDFEYAVVNSVAAGGTNVSLVLRRWDAKSEERKS